LKIKAGSARKALCNIPKLVYPTLLYHSYFSLPNTFLTKEWSSTKHCLWPYVQARAQAVKHNSWIEAQSKIFDASPRCLLTATNYLLPWSHQLETSYTLTFCHVTFFGWHGSIMTIWNSWKEKFGDFVALRTWVNASL
jgi:hypothetical protein